MTTMENARAQYVASIAHELWYDLEISDIKEAFEAGYRAGADHGKTVDHLSKSDWLNVVCFVGLHREDLADKLSRWLDQHKEAVQYGT